MSGPTWNEKIELPGVSNPVSDIQFSFQDIFTKHEKLADNTPIRIYVSKIKKIYYI